MDLMRKIFDSSYTLFKPFLFYATRKDPEIAHEFFLSFSKFLIKNHLEKFVLDNKTNYNKLSFEISNAAGFDKNAEIPPKFFRYLGFDRVTYGTITGEKHDGKPRPRTKRIKGNSLINNIGWDNDGAEIVLRRLRKYKNCDIPISLNIGFTPNPKLNIEQRFIDLEKMLILMKEISYIKEIEYNPSCGNLCISREENQKLSGEFVRFVRNYLSPWQELNVKVSPDMDKKEIFDFIDSTYDFTDGYITTNTTKKHNYPPGSASGEILYNLAFDTQKIFYEILKDSDKKIIACGGIDSIEKAKKRIEFEPQDNKRIQIFTPLIFKGTKLLRKLRE
jgi:dihydroorotate dehydrogenase